ncbi:atrial natriuretic peptide receptor 1-like [Paramacrobiotus metropolitanus]|uniref:atrial natriuretic peptide receptor 1-like n=1 Tax=Paramacrobiotus metropolitanus TaxID=2943436 RepID=UPI002445BF6B|nr:atrial natriuretic peptide receptor 1-like [Paramacrobiotus metropolitanus]
MNQTRSSQQLVQLLPVLIYSACADFDTLSQLGKEWNMLTILTGLTIKGFRDRDRYPTSISLGYFNFHGYLSIVAALLRRYSWQTVCLAYDVSQQIPFSYNIYRRLDSYLKKLIITMKTDDSLENGHCSKGHRHNSRTSDSGCPERRRLQLFAYAHNASDTIDYGRIVADIALNCRVVIISSTPLVTREILIQAFRRQQGNFHEYVWISLELPENPLGLTRWHSSGGIPNANVTRTFCSTTTKQNCNSIENEENSDEVALAAFSKASILQVVNCIEHDEQLAGSLRSQFMNLTIEKYNASYKPGSKPTESTMSAYSAVHVMASVINESFSDFNLAAGPYNYENKKQWPFGSMLAEKFLNREFADGENGGVFVDDFGERQVPVCVSIFDRQTKLFQRVQILDHTNQDLQEIRNTSFKLVWKTPDGKPPQNEPVCGFRNQKCSSNTENDLMLALVVTCGSLSFGLIVVALFMRRLLRNGADARWQLDVSQLKVQLQQRSTGVRYHKASTLISDSVEPAKPFKADSTDFVGCSSDPSAIALLQMHGGGRHVTVFYQGVMVFAKMFFLRVASEQLVTRRKSISRQKSVSEAESTLLFTFSKAIRLIQQVWQLSHHHMNISTVIGFHLCPISIPPGDEPGVCAIVLSEYCHRGNIADLIRSNVRLDWDMLTSLFMDLTQAIFLVHTSPLHRHGHLRPEVCLVDKRLSLKLACVGIYDIFGTDRRFCLSSSPSANNLPDLVSRPCTEATKAFNKDYLAKWCTPELQGFLYSSQCNDMVALVIHALNTQSADMYSLSKIFQYFLDYYMEQETPAGKHATGTSQPEDRVRTSTMSGKRIRVTINTADRRYTTVRHEIPKHRNSKRSQARMRLHMTISACLNGDPSKRPTIQRIRAVMKELNTGDDTGHSVVEVFMKRIEKYTGQLEQAVAERSQELLNERRLCDELLQEMLPIEIIRRLKSGEEIQPENFASVSIMFSYLPGFSEFSAYQKESPVVVTIFLNELFGQFDKALSAFRVYKVETVGDSYMVASGLPVVYDKHAWELCRGSCALRQAFAKVLTRHTALDNSNRQRIKMDDTLQIQIGINTGACVAGVVGLKMPRYCLFGDAINTASRLASHSEPGRIQISSRTYDHFITVCKSDQPQLLTVTQRGSVLLKGKGSELTYWLDELPA